ncbi:hypothetical protein SXCC_04075 [Gluconacetobacter sp. SXCC-1]|nr:hypothetical protein SXCC_04075 [Gluconacetobacter sp. SXCC-1]
MEVHAFWNRMLADDTFWRTSAICIGNRNICLSQYLLWHLQTGARFGIG